MPSPIKCDGMTCTVLKMVLGLVYYRTDENAVQPYLSEIEKKELNIFVVGHRHSFSVS